MNINACWNGKKIEKEMKWVSILPFKYPAIKATAKESEPTNTKHVHDRKTNLFTLQAYNLFA